jgi:hypothetical protein
VVHLDITREGKQVRGIKRCCGVERARGKAAIIVHHLLLGLRAFLQLDLPFEDRVKLVILREAIRAAIAHPFYILNPTV